MIEKTDFTNYDARSDIQFEGLKLLIPTATNTAENDRKIEEGQFSFKLTTLLSPKDDPIEETVKNDADGKFVFTKIDYDLESMVRDTVGYEHPLTTFYQYQIEEILPDDYDQTIDFDYNDLVYYVTVRLRYAWDAEKKDMFMTADDREDRHNSNRYRC